MKIIRICLVSVRALFQRKCERLRHAVAEPLNQCVIHVAERDDGIHARKDHAVCDR